MFLGNGVYFYLAEGAAVTFEAVFRAAGAPSSPRSTHANGR
jgi:hypothetical protein